MEVDLHDTSFPEEDNKVSDKPVFTPAIDNLIETLFKPLNPQENFIKAMLDVIIF